MSILKLFSGPSPEKLEQKGDALFEAKIWGQAKQAYERAFFKLKKRPDTDIEDQKRIEGKICQAKELLARSHQQSAEHFITGGHLEDARELLTLALEITADIRFKRELEDRLQWIDSRRNQETEREFPEVSYATEEDGDATWDASDDEYFHALCGPLPEAVQDAYLGYSQDFRIGFISLNRGDFQTAATYLLRAMEENAEPDSYIPLELAAAFLNLGRSEEAKALLEGFLKYHPDVLPAYRLLCEIYWEAKDFVKIDTLLASVPDELAGSLAVVLLKGKTLYQAGHLKEARDFYLGVLETYGWNDTVAGDLAKTYEALNEPGRARRLYKEIMDSCNTCRTRVDPAVKHQYAELCFTAGMYDTDILELYLSLAREIPDNAAAYFDRISRIYTAQGNAPEAERFRSFARRAETERDGPGARDPDLFGIDPDG